MGSYIYLDGGEYRGEWVDDKIHGKGVSMYANGNTYDGEVSRGGGPRKLVKSAARIITNATCLRLIVS